MAQPALAADAPFALRHTLWSMGILELIGLLILATALVIGPRDTEDVPDAFVLLGAYVSCWTFWLPAAFLFHRACARGWRAIDEPGRRTHAGLRVLVAVLPPVHVLGPYLLFASYPRLFRRCLERRGLEQPPRFGTGLRCTALASWACLFGTYAWFLLPWWDTEGDFATAGHATFLGLVLVAWIAHFFAVRDFAVAVRWFHDWGHARAGAQLRSRTETLPPVAPAGGRA